MHSCSIAIASSTFGTVRRLTRWKRPKQRVLLKSLRVTNVVAMLRLLSWTKTQQTLKWNNSGKPLVVKARSNLRLKAVMIRRPRRSKQIVSSCTIWRGKKRTNH